MQGIMVEQANDVYKKFYPNLLEADLPIETLIKQLQGIDLFTDHHVKQLETCDTAKAKIRYVLDHVIEPSLKSGNTKSLDVIMKVMEESGDADSILLAKEMKILYNSEPNYESNDESPDPTLSSEDAVEDCREVDHQDHVLPAVDEVDGKIKRALTSVAGVVFPKLKKKDNHQDLAASGHASSLNRARDYSNIKQEIRIINKYGPSSRRSQLLGSPWLLAKGAGDMLFVRDSRTHQVVAFDHRLKFSHLIGTQGELKSIGGIAVNDETGIVYVADQLLHCVQIFKLNGELVSRIGCKGTGDGEFRSPCGLLLSSTESLFVCDSNNHRIQVFHHNHIFAYTFGQRGLDPGCFEKPEALALNSTEDKLFISSDNRVQVFTTSGQFIKVFNHFNSASHQLLTPVGIWCTPDGHVLISSYGTHCVYVLKENGTHVSVIKGSHQGKTRFVFPAGVIVRDNGNIVIASSGNHQLAVF